MPWGGVRACGVAWECGEGLCGKEGWEGWWGALAVQYCARMLLPRVPVVRLCASPMLLGAAGPLSWWSRPRARRGPRALMPRPRLAR